MSHASSAARRSRAMLTCCSNASAAFAGSTWPASTRRSAQCPRCVAAQRPLADTRSAAFTQPSLHHQAHAHVRPPAGSKPGCCWSFATVAALRLSGSSQAVATCASNFLGMTVADCVLERASGRVGVHLLRRGKGPATAAPARLHAAREVPRRRRWRGACPHHGPLDGPRRGESWICLSWPVVRAAGKDALRAPGKTADPSNPAE